jgi:hypothetical protein
MERERAKCRLRRRGAPLSSYANELWCAVKRANNPPASMESI